MNEEEIRQRIETGRHFMANWNEPGDEEILSDQQKRVKQPPLVKEPMRDRDAAVRLPQNFEDLTLINDTLTLFESRKSNRVYTEEPVSLLELSWLLYATQGVKKIRGKSYATLRTVPSGGARHAFECYMLIRHVEGLVCGAYHYLPMTHEIELLATADELSEKFGMSYEELISKTMQNQKWTAKGNVLFYYSMVAYRAEWRYSVHSHRVALIDAGHVTENLYLAATAEGLGTCAIGAVDTDLCDRVFELDGEEEFSFYAAAVGTISEENAQAEDDFYAFVKRDNL